MSKIILPSNPVKILELAQTILEKHQDDGETSYLNLVITGDFQQKVTNGLQLNTMAKKLEKQVEKIYKERDAFVKEALKTIKRTRDLLKGIYSDNLRQLGDYGFTVND